MVNPGPAPWPGRPVSGPAPPPGPPRRRRSAGLIVVAIVVPILALGAGFVGCRALVTSLSSPPAPLGPTPTLPETTARMDQVIQATVPALPPGSRLDPPTTDLQPCSAYPGAVRVTRTYEVRDVPPTGPPTFLPWAQMIESQWERSGYVFERSFELDDGSFSESWWSTPSFTGDPQDTIEVGVEIDYRARTADQEAGLLINSQSPCLWPDGTPP